MAGKPIIPINPAAVFLAVTGAGLIGSWAHSARPKLEDSGLMLFSRWPFSCAARRAGRQPAAPRSPSAELTPLGFPEVGFLPYDDSTGNDAWAAKGMVYARIERSAWQTYHVFGSHTQADSDVVSENKDERREQFADVAKFVRDAVGSDPTDEAVFLMGDFNIPGGQEAAVTYGDILEWDERFSTPGAGLLSDRLIDVWGASSAPASACRPSIGACVIPATRQPCATGLPSSGSTTCSATTATT